jgi:hypothetical protein
VVAEILPPSLGENDSSDKPITDEWDSLPPPEILSGNILGPDTRPEDLPLCPVCQEPIIRDPSWKRMHKYHDGCKPGSGSDAGSATTTRGAAKAVKEADEVVALYRSAMVKAALGLSVFDKYDAFVVMSNLDAQCTALHGVMLRYEKFRKECLAVKGGGSIFGFALSLLFTALPIAAHHGLIPSANLAKMLTELPFTLFTLAQKVKEGEDALTRMMKDQADAMRQQKDESEAARKQSAQNGNRKAYVPGTANVGPS